MDAQVVIVGGGGTGGALAHDLTLRGLRVTLVERGELTSGTTGRHHGLLHSGARYAVGDPESATECIQENRILRRIAPGSFEENGGLFVALTDEDADGLAGFLAACAACSIPTRELSPDQALRLEPGLAPTLKAAVWVPDATMDAMRLPLRFFATARANGAVLRPFTEVFGVLRSGGTVTGVAVRDHLAGRDAVISADVVVNAAGPWCGRVGGPLGRGGRARAAVARRAARAARPPLRAGGQPPAPRRGRRHRAAAAGPLGRRHQLVGGRRPRRPRGAR